MQTINIPAATREEYRLVFALARAAVVGDQMTQAAINKVALYQEALWARTDQAQAQRQADADAQAAATPPAPKSKSAVEKHGINSPEAQAARDARRAAKQQEEAAKAFAEQKAEEARKREEKRAQQQAQRDAQKAGDTTGDAPPSG